MNTTRSERDQATHNKIVSFIRGIADDVLRDLFERGKYPDVILPMCVLRRMDVDAAVCNISHAAALLLHSRVAEAQRYLDRAEPAKLKPAEASGFYFIAFKAAVLAGDREAAGRPRDRINRTDLYPTQVAWLEATGRSFLESTNSPPLSRPR